MSFDQSLISRGKDGMYAAAWLAGNSGSQGLTKYFKSHDIESVNVPKTCDALKLALQADAVETVGEAAVIPFRICTKLLVGTLKIFQQQVNNLYRLSEDLVVKSSKYDAYEASTKETKPSNNKTIKKRKLTITHSDEHGGTTNINYSEILDDLVKLVDESHEDNEAIEVPPTKTHVKRQPTRLQIREITIRELNATYGIPELDDECGFVEASNEDIMQFFTFSGRLEEQHAPFEKRTAINRKSGYEDEAFEEPTKLIYEDDHSPFLKRTSLKRKSIHEDNQSAEKQNRISHELFTLLTTQQKLDCSMDILRSGGGRNSMATDFLKTPRRLQKSSAEDTPGKERHIHDDDHTSFLLKRTTYKRKSSYEEVVKEKKYRPSNDFAMSKQLSDSNIMNTDLMATPPRDYGTPNEGCKYETTTDMTPINKDMIKEEFDSDYEAVYVKPDLAVDSKFAIPNTLKKDIKVESLLIIDHCIKLEEQEILGQLQKPLKDLRGVTKDIFSKSKSKRNNAAKKLLNRFNKRTMLFCSKLKQKHPHAADAIQMQQQEYLNLLHDILNCEHTEKWASEVYPKWRMMDNKIPQKSKKNVIIRDGNNNIRLNHEINNCNVPNEIMNTFVYDDVEDICWNKANPLDQVNYQMSPKKSNYKDNFENNVTPNEWRPYGVMTKLLQEWRFSTETKINAEEFCHSANCRINKALAFWSLLILSKSRFISLSHRSKNNQMDKIVLGVAAKHLMEVT